MNDEQLILKAYVEASSYRERALKSIGEDTITPKQIAMNSQIRQNHISKTLKELKEHELVECINEEMRKGRLYRLTPLGMKILSEMN